MGLKDKMNRKRRRRLFGRPLGKQSRIYRNIQKRKLIRQEEKSKRFKTDTHFYPPYSIVRQQIYSNGKLSCKVTVRRLHLSLIMRKKLIRVGENSLKFKVQQEIHKLSGYRIMNLDLLKTYVPTITTHCCICKDAQELVSQGKDPIVLKSELRRNSLFSVIKAECNGCKKEFPLHTSFKQSNGLYDINVRAVWGSVTSGSGSSNLNELLTTMDVPGMNEQKFTSLEQEIGSWWYTSLKQEMHKAAAEEKRIAIEKGSFHHDIPAITVICDGGWSKRTHKHSYNAPGGVAVIFGAETKKLLFIGVRNKYCVICRRAENAGEEPKPHKCYSNWKESSQAMEADIILEGFLSAESEFGLRYTKVIGDGDSSVFATLQDRVPVWGKDIVKMECANHTCKCIRSNLEKLVCEKPQYKGKGKLTKVTRARLTTAIRCAIKMRSETKDVKQLKKDILNSIYHILGFHARCSDFCTKKNPACLSNEQYEDCEDDPDNSFDTIFDEQQEYWKIPTEQELERSRSPNKNQVPLTELKDLIHDVQIILNRTAEKSQRLIGNFTTNLAESWMAIRAKFDGGKVVNRCSRGSWQTRCYGGALRKNLGSAWSPLTFQTVTSTKAGVNFIQGAKRQTQKLLHAKKYKENPANKVKRNKRKLVEASQSVTKKARRSYGSNLDDSADIEPLKLQVMCTNFFEKNFNKNKDELDNIEKNTLDQAKSEKWKKERRIRLTSSNFGKIMKRRPTNISSKLVKDMIYPSFKGNIFTIRGLSEESNTIIEYKNVKGNVNVEKAGFKIDSNYQFLGTSTDGMVNYEKEKGLLEIKNFLQNNQFLIAEAIKKVPNFCLELKNNNISLKRNHDIYYQIQGQLNIHALNWCDFVLRRTNPYDIHIERIYRDQTLWKNIMLPKLECYFRKFMLPELVHPRYGTYTGIREPESPWYDDQLLPRQTTQRRTQRTVTPPRTETPPLIPPASPEPTPSTSQGTNVTYLGAVTRSKRETTVKFLGRRILHEWVLDESTGEKKWYPGVVTDVLKGKDGDRNGKAVYEIQYEGEDEPYEVDNLLTDYRQGSVKFKDL